jgi:hypothetical protein
MANPWNLRLLTDRAIMNVTVPGPEPAYIQNIVVEMQFGLGASLASNAPFTYVGNSTVFFDEAVVTSPLTVPALIPGGDAANAEYVRAA